MMVELCVVGYALGSVATLLVYRALWARARTLYRDYCQGRERGSFTTGWNEDNLLLLKAACLSAIWPATLLGYGGYKLRALPDALGAWSAHKQIARELRQAEAAKLLAALDDEIQR